MKRIRFLLMVLMSVTGCRAQEDFGTQYLKLEKVIEMPGVNGRIDHLAVNLKENKIFVAALGNNSVEVIDLIKGAVVHSIKGLDEPQGVAFIPERNEIVVTNGGNGKCIFFKASDYTKTATLDLPGDADNIRYTPFNGRIYIGYGDGGIAIIDAGTHKQIADVKLTAHPESFQVDGKNNLLFVNLPGIKSISVIDIINFKVVSTWKAGNLNANFPMALDTAYDQVLIGYRHPSVVVSYDIKTGKEVNRAELVNDVDDLFYDEMTNQVISSGGGGSINIFKKSKGTYKKIAKISTRSGARTSLLIPSLRLFILAERANGGKKAAIAVYKIANYKAEQ
jgi:DNA-binding beta-propeller fold protein YncE